MRHCSGSVGARSSRRPAALADRDLDQPRDLNDQRVDPRTLACRDSRRATAELFFATALAKIFWRPTPPHCLSPLQFAKLVAQIGQQLDQLVEFVGGHVRISRCVTPL
jgi:hypothetical protein